MPNDQNIISLASEHLPFINIPEEILNFIRQLRPRLSASSILVYLHYWRLWRYGDYKLSIANHDLAEHVRRQLSCPVRDNYDGRLGGLTFYSLQPA